MPADFTILHLSDTHFAADGVRHYGVTDTEAGLAAVLGRAASLARLDLVACTGDLSDDGSPDSYRRLRAAIEPWAAERGAQVAYAMGNHDVAEPFAAVLLGSADAPRHWARMVGGTRVVVLDTAVPQAGYGALGTEQLRWLAGVLAEPAPAGTVLALHHPPIPAETDLLRALELQDRQALVEAVRGSDVRVILAGHYHAAIVDQAGGIPVVVAPGITNQSDVFARPGTEAAVAGSGASLVRLRADGGVRVLPFTAALPGDGARIFDHDAAMVAAIIAQAGPR